MMLPSTLWIRQRNSRVRNGTTISGSRQEISGDASRACVSEICPYDVAEDEGEMGADGAKTVCDATRVGAKDQVWEEAGIDPRKK